jgi:hypothetical protein
MTGGALKDRPTRWGNPWPRRALVICIPAGVCASGCDRDAGDSGVETVNVTPATAPSAATTRSFATPFVGHVAARETLGPVVVAQVSYTIDAKRIRREKTDHRDVVTEHVARTSPRSGVIIDLMRGRAILYSTYLDHRVAVELTLDEFDRHVQAVREPRIKREPYGTAFLSLRGQTVRATNEPGSTRIDGVPCDVLRLEAPQAVYEVHHAPAMFVDRALIERVEPGIPQQVTGFPLRVQPMTMTTVPTTAPTSPGPVRIGQVVDAGRRATTRAANALNAKLDAIAVDLTTPDPGAFEVPEGFERCKDLADFIRRTGGEGGGGIDFD